MDLKSIPIFSFLLSRGNGSMLKANSPIELHGAFYKLCENNPSLMKEFEFRKTTNPYSITLQELISLYVMAGILSPAYAGMSFKGYLINRVRLKDLMPENIDDVEKEFKGLQYLDKIFI